MTGSRTAVEEWRNFWFLPLVAALGYSSSVLHIYSFGAFIEPLQHEFGWTRAQASMGVTISSIGSAIFCIPVGMVVDRFGPRLLGLVGVLLLSGAVALLSTATGQLTNWAILWGTIAIGTFCVQATVWNSAVASRFETTRGLAFAVTLSGASIGATVFPIMATWLIGDYGWRTAFVGLGGLWAALVFPLLFLFFRGAQDQQRTETQTSEALARVHAGLSMSEGLRSPVLYKLMMASCFFSFIVVGAVVHFVPILTDSGASKLAAAGIASLIGIFSIVGRLGTGVLLDRFPAHLVGAAAFMLPIIAAVLLLSDGASSVSQAIAAGIFGLTLGSEVDVVAYLATRHFGLRNFGALYGALVMSLSLGTAFGPFAAGALFDHYGGYAPFLMLGIVLMAISAVTLISLGPAPSRMVEGAQAH